MPQEPRPIHNMTGSLPGKFQFLRILIFLLTSFSTAGIACCVTHFWFCTVGCLLPPSLTECTSVRRNHAKYSFQSWVHISMRQYRTFNLRYNVCLLYAKIDEASFRLPYAFKCFIISSFLIHNVQRPPPPHADEYLLRAAIKLAVRLPALVE